MCPMAVAARTCAVDRARVLGVDGGRDAEGGAAAGLCEDREDDHEDHGLGHLGLRNVERWIGGLVE